MTPSEAVTQWQRRWWRAGVAVAVAAVLAAAGVVVARSGAEPTSEVRDGEQRAIASPAPADASARAPEVVFERFDGQQARLEDWRGRPVVVNFWASWCPPCVAEMRDAFEPLHAEFGDRVVFLGIDVQDTPAAARQVVERTGVTYELAVDPDGALFTAFGGFGMPTTVLVNADGRIVAQHTGALTRADLDALIGQHLLGG
jgi:thiol-disulfide isomerase/thioredoxin